MKRMVRWYGFWILAICLSVALTGPGLGRVAYAKTKLVVWWNKGYYKEERDAEDCRWVFHAGQRGTRIDLPLQDDLGPKIISSLIARRVPHVAFCFFTDLQTAPKFAWEGKLGEVSDLIKELKARHFESHLKTGWLYNQTAKKLSYHTFPMLQNLYLICSLLSMVAIATYAFLYSWKEYH